MRFKADWFSEVRFMFMQRVLWDRTSICTTYLFYVLLLSANECQLYAVFPGGSLLTNANVSGGKKNHLFASRRSFLLLRGERRIAFLARYLGLYTLTSAPQMGHGSSGG